MQTSEIHVIDSHDIAPGKAFGLLKASVVPRPIAWTSTISPEGVHNLAPFSFFTVVSSDPAMVLLSLEAHDSGRLKDTASNIAATGEFVINIASSAHARAVEATSTPFEPGVDEIAHAGLTPVPCRHVRAPRLAEASISLECRLHSTVAPGSDQLIIGEVIAFHVASHVLDADGHIDVDLVDPLARTAADFARIVPLTNAYRQEMSCPKHR
jgi:flavin reductase (DIM6/NTAB) family NADH-FMN oxidoreductase RutF